MEAFPQIRNSKTFALRRVYEDTNVCWTCEDIPSRFRPIPLERLKFNHSMPAGGQRELVSVIMPTFNGSGTIQAAIRSVTEQSYRPLELILVDDGSTDQTAAVVQGQFSSVGSSSSLRLRYLKQEHRGVASARNRGLAESRGQFLQYLDSDDTMHRDKIKLQVAHAQSAGRRALTYGPWQTLVTGNGSPLARMPGENLREGQDPIKEYLDGRYVPVHGLLWPREAAIKVGFWDETLRINEDGDMFLRAVVLGWRPSYCPGGVVFYHRPRCAMETVSSQRTEEAYISQITSLVRLQLLLRDQNLLEAYRQALARFYLNRATSQAMLFPDVARDCLKLSDGVAPSWGLGRKWLNRALIGTTWACIELDKTGLLRVTLRTLHSLGRAMRRSSLNRHQESMGCKSQRHP